MSQPGGETAIQVEIDLFSGRANPVWRLTAAEFRELTARLQSLPVGPPVAIPEDRLGYRGLHVGPLPAPRGQQEPAAAQAIMAVAAGGGLINATRRDGSVLHLIDADHTVECWLLQIAQGRVDEASRLAALDALPNRCR